MFSQEFIKNLKSKKTLVILLILGAMILSLVFSFIQTFEYECDASLYVIQNQNGLLAKDAYAAAKSAEKLAKNMAKMVYTSTFMERIFDTEYGISRDILPQEEVKKRKEWDNKIDTYVVPETGILEISVYDQDKDIAEKITQAIIYVLITEGEDFHGGGNDVEVKIADAPILSKYPMRPNIILNLAMALILGAVTSLVIVFMTTSGDEGIFDVTRNKYISDSLANLEGLKEQIKPLYSSIDNANQKLDFLARRDNQPDFTELKRNFNDKLENIRQELGAMVNSQKNEVGEHVAELNSQVARQIDQLKKGLVSIGNKLNEAKPEIDLSYIEDGLVQNKLAINSAIEEIKGLALADTIRELIAEKSQISQEELSRIETQLDKLATKDNIRLVIEKQKENRFDPANLDKFIARIEELTQQKGDGQQLVAQLEMINKNIKAVIAKQDDIQNNQKVDQRDDEVLRLMTEKIESMIDRQNNVYQRLDELKIVQRELSQISQKIAQLDNDDAVTKDDLESLIARQNELLSRENERNQKYKAEAERIRQNLSRLENKLNNYVTKDKVARLAADQQQFLSKNDLRKLIQGEDDSQNKLESQVRHSNDSGDSGPDDNFQPRLN